MWGLVAYQAAQTLLGTNSQVKVAKAQNRAMMTNLGKEITQINLQRAQSLKQTSQALFNIDQASASAQGQISLQAAASGTMGASVKDAVSTVNIASDRQTASVYSQQDAQMEQYRLLTQRAVDSAHNNMDWESGTDKLWNNTLSAMGKFVGHWLGNQLSSSGETPAGVSAAEGSDSVTSSFNDPTGAVDSKDYGYDLWGRQAGAAASSTSWKSYLNN